VTVEGPVLDEHTASEVLMARMTGGELWVARDGVGLDRADLAQILEVTPAAIAGWEQSKTPVPHRVTETIRDLEVTTEDAVARLVAELRAMPDPQVAIFWRPDAVPPSRADAARYGFRWWRQVVHRALKQVPETRVGSPAEIAGIEIESLDIEQAGHREYRREKKA
jgi:transcriptional regulator with XRE-family HTH domain